MQCPQCHYDAPVDAVFCPKCGSKLTLLCAQCQTANAPDHKFCKQCGQPLATSSVRTPGGMQSTSPQSYTPRYLAEKILTSRGAMEGERKEVTVLFCDVVGSSSLAERLDPEVMHQIMDRALRLMAEAIHRYEGTVNQFLGDGLMALFGAPVALEDHALRAVMAALMISETISAYNAELLSERNMEIHLRLGLNTGMVVVGRIGDDLRMDYTAVGDTTNVAARLQSLAQPGTILVAEPTYRLVEGYVRSEAQGPVQLRGRSQPVPVYSIIGRRPGRSRLEVSIDRGLTPLVGRERELNLLHDCLARAEAGRGQVVGIVGEPGIGKSRLLYEFRKSLEGERIVWLEGHCVAYGQNTPYLPILEVLRAGFQIEDGDTVLQLREKLRQGLRQLDPSFEGLLPYLAELFGLPIEADTLAQLHPHLKQWKTFEALRAMTMAGSQCRPHVIVIEDLHWLDKASEEYLTFLIESLAGMPVLLLTAHRPGYAVRWAAKTYYTQIALDRLTRQEIEDLLYTLLGADAWLAPLKQLLRERTEGNPFFLEESVRMLIDSEILAGERGAYRPIKPLLAIQVPSTVQAVLAARVDRLPAEDKHLLQTAAVIGKQVPLALLQAVADQPEDALRRGLARLQAGEFLYDMGLFPDVQYSFTHSLTYEVTYGGLLQERRRALHARIIEAIEDLYADRLVEWRDRLAYHVVRGEVWSKAPIYFSQNPTVAPPAMEASFWWVGEHDRAIELMQRDLRASNEFKDFAGRVLANFCLGQAYHALGDYPRAIDFLQRNVGALEDDLLYERFDLPGLASVLSRAWWVWCLAEQGMFGEGTSYGEDAVQIAETGDHPYSLIIACFGLGTLYLQQGGLAQAIAALERGMSLSEDENLAQLFPLVAAPLGVAYALVGRVAEGVSLLETAVEQAAALNFMGTQARRLAWLGEAYLLAGRRDEAMASAAKALDLARAHKERGHEAWSLRLLGDIQAQLNPSAVEAAETSYRQALALAEELRMAPLLAHSLLGLGRLYARSGRPQQARAELSSAVDLFRAMEMERWLPEAEAALTQAGGQAVHRGTDVPAQPS
jgi:class 3 adenylate cyclase/tetratricopeptide (TPR) repeat protein